MAGDGKGASRRDILKYTGAGAGTAALAGCKTRPTPEAPAGGGLENQTFKVGVLAPSPGSFAVGTSMVRSAKLAAETINNDGGIAGANVEILVGDTEVAPATGQEEYVRLTRQERCDITMGTFLDQVNLNIMPSMKETEKIHITTAAPGPKQARYVSTDKRYDEFKYHFRVGPINSYDLAKAQLELLDTYLGDIGWETAAVLVENIGPLDPFFEFLQGKIEEYLDVKLYKRTSSGTTNWTPIYEEVDNADVDVALTFLALTSTAAVKQWYTQKRDFEMGGILLYDQMYTFWSNVDGACEYTFTMNAITPQTTNTPRTQDFMKRYRERFTPDDANVPTYPVYSGPITYDALNVFRKAVENYVKDNDPQGKPSSEELIPYMEDVRFTNGIIIPEFQFTPKDAKYAHDPQWSSMKETGVPVWQQWQTDREVIENYGVMHSFAPEQNKTADYAIPEWIDRQTP